jgi:hypothetical protein
MAFYISGPKLLFETTEISTHPNSTQQELNYIYLYTTKFGTSIKIRLNRKFETMRVNWGDFDKCGGDIDVGDFAVGRFDQLPHISSPRSLQLGISPEKPDHDSKRNSIKCPRSPTNIGTDRDRLREHGLRARRPYFAQYWDVGIDLQGSDGATK